MEGTSTARRVRKNPEERRAELASAAQSIALTEGLGAVTLRAVASRAGVAPGLVAHHAPGMDALVADTFGAIVAGELAGVTALMATADAAAARLGLLIGTVLDGSRRDVTLVWVQGWALGVRNAALAERVRREMDGWQRAIAAEIERGRDAGEFGAVDSDAVAWLLLGMIDGLSAHGLVRWRDDPDRAALTRRVIADLLGVDPSAFEVGA